MSKRTSLLLLLLAVLALYLSPASQAASPGECGDEVENPVPSLSREELYAKIPELARRRAEALEVTVAEADRLIKLGYEDPFLAARLNREADSLNLVVPREVLPQGMMLLPIAAKANARGKTMARPGLYRTYRPEDSKWQVVVGKASIVFGVYLRSLDWNGPLRSLHYTELPQKLLLNRKSDGVLFARAFRIGFAEGSPEASHKVYYASSMREKLGKLDAKSFAVLQRKIGDLVDTVLEHGEKSFSQPGVWVVAIGNGETLEAARADAVISSEVASKPSGAVTGDIDLRTWTGEAIPGRTGFTKAIPSQIEAQLSVIFPKEARSKK